MALAEISINDEKHERQLALDRLINLIPKLSLRKLTFFWQLSIEIFHQASLMIKAKQ